MERIVHMQPAFDKRSNEPGKNYGIHGVSMRMVLKGGLGAVGFVLYTNWHLPHVEDELDRKVGGKFPHLSCHPIPADLGYHALAPRYEGQGSMGPCEYLDGRDCYYDGSSLNATSIYRVLLEQGSDGVWAALDSYYRHLFEGAEWSLPYPDEWKVGR